MPSFAGVLLQFGEGDHIVLVLAAHLIEVPAGDESQPRVIDVRINFIRGKRILSIFLRLSTRNTAVLPSLRSTKTSLPGLSRARSKKTPRSEFQAIWPAMTAGPISPGVGDCEYQPAGFAGGGTCSEPSFLSPRSINVESTPIVGIRSLTGTDRGMYELACLVLSAAKKVDQARIDSCSRLLESHLSTRGI